MSRNCNLPEFMGRIYPSSPHEEWVGMSSSNCCLKNKNIRYYRFDFINGGIRRFTVGPLCYNCKKSIEASLINLDETEITENEYESLSVLLS